MRSKNMCKRDTSHSAFFGTKEGRKDTPNFISSGWKINKLLRRRQYYPLTIETTIYKYFAWLFYSIVQTFPKALHSD